MAEWREFQLWYAIPIDPDSLFVFKKTYLLPVLRKYDIEDFLVLDEPEFMLVRVKVDDELSKQIQSSLEKVIQSEQKMLFSKVTVETWSPVKDAKDRILAARNRAGIPEDIPEGGWMIKDRTPNGKWVSAPENLDKQIAAFSTFMSRVVGRFTKAYLKEMPYRVEDRWLISVFLHLLLDSISTWQKEENESRAFPYC